MKRVILIVALLLSLASLALAATVSFQIQWEAPTTNADGTPLDDLSHYKFYVCDSVIADDKTCQGVMSTFEIPGGELDAIVTYQAASRNGTIFVRGSALDTSGNESVLSNQVGFEFSDQIPPNTIIIQIVLP